MVVFHKTSRRTGRNISPMELSCFSEASLAESLPQRACLISHHKQRMVFDPNQPTPPLTVLSCVCHSKSRNCKSGWQRWGQEGICSRNTHSSWPFALQFLIYAFLCTMCWLWVICLGAEGWQLICAFLPKKQKTGRPSPEASVSSCV
jgi:hypothetical protein